MPRYLLFSTLILILALSACQSATAPVVVVGQKVAAGDGFYTDVTPAELKSILVDKNFTLVYVHVPPGAMIASTDLSIPYTYITQNLDKLPADKDAKIVLYCRSGRMSAIAAKELLSLGYTNLLNPAGGTVAWQEAGLLLEGELPKQNNMNISNLAYTAHAPDYASSPASRHL